MGRSLIIDVVMWVWVRVWDFVLLVYVFLKDCYWNGYAELKYGDSDMGRMDGIVGVIFDEINQELQKMLCEIHFYDYGRDQLPHRDGCGLVGRNVYNDHFTVYLSDEDILVTVTFKNEQYELRVVYEDPEAFEKVYDFVGGGYVFSEYSDEYD